MSTQIETPEVVETVIPRNRSRKATVVAVARQMTAIALVIIVLLPVWFIVASALSGQNDIIKTFAPPHRSLENFSRLFDTKSVHFTDWVRNTLLVCSVTSTINVLVGGLGAYAFSRMRFKGRRAALLTLLMIQVFPSFLALSAIYYIMSKITDYAPAIGIGTPWALILVYSGGALGINAWLIKGFFDTLPKELDESAMIDGATHTQIFFKIILPLAVPALAVVFMLSFIGTMNDFIMASLMLGAEPKNQTLAVGLYQFISGAGYENKWGAFTAGSLLAAVPVVIIFISLQKYIVNGLTAGSVKG